MTDEHSHGNSTSPTLDEADAASTTPKSDETVATRTSITTCAARLTGGQAVVAEAEIGVGHWSEHVQARTDLLAGRNTDAQTKDIWKRTRLAGPDDLTRFATSLSAYNALPGCDDLDTGEAPESLRADIDACLGRTASTETAVAAAAAAMGDWESHQNAMAAHAHGDMDAAEAQAMWVEAWENAPTNIEGFNNARDELEASPTCGGTP